MSIKKELVYQIIGILLKIADINITIFCLLTVFLFVGLSVLSWQAEHTTYTNHHVTSMKVYYYLVCMKSNISTAILYTSRDNNYCYKSL